MYSLNMMERGIRSLQSRHIRKHDLTVEDANCRKRLSVLSGAVCPNSRRLISSLLQYPRLREQVVLGSFRVGKVVGPFTRVFLEAAPFKRSMLS